MRMDVDCMSIVHILNKYKGRKEPGDARCSVHRALISISQLARAATRDLHTLSVLPQPHPNLAVDPHLATATLCGWLHQ